MKKPNTPKRMTDRPQQAAPDKNKLRHLGRHIGRAVRALARWLRTPLARQVAHKIGEALLAHCAKTAVCLIVPMLV